MIENLLLTYRRWVDPKKMLTRWPHSPCCPLQEPSIHYVDDCYIINHSSSTGTGQPKSLCSFATSIQCSGKKKVLARTIEQFERKQLPTQIILPQDYQFPDILTNDNFMSIEWSKNKLRTELVCTKRSFDVLWIFSSYHWLKRFQTTESTLQNLPDQPIGLKSLQ